MTPTEAFRAARQVLLENATDLDKARAQFLWPRLTSFNWARDWFDEIARDNQRDALVVVAEDGSSERVSYAAMAERSQRVARYLADAGVQRGDRVLLMLPNVVPLWETVLATMRLGAVLIPATAQLTADDVDDRIARGDVKHVITDAAGASKVRDPSKLKVKLVHGSFAGFSSFDDARNAKADAPRVDTQASDPLLLYFTSGTTAKPKLVLHTHESYPVGHLSTMYWIGLREGDVHQNISSPGWAKHAWSSVFAPWNAGATVLVRDQPKFSPAVTLQTLEEHAVTTLCAPPTVWRMLILHDLGQKPRALREVVSAGEPLNPEVIERVKSAWGITIRDGYGQTETTAQIANPPGLAVKPGSMGKPLPGYDIVLVDADGNARDEGEVAVKLRPTPLMVGYLDDPERTHAVTQHGVYRTGDEATRDSEGYLHFVGRGDDVFKSSDYRISPFELESVLVEHPLVAEAAVVPSPDAVRLSVPKAFITLVPDAAANAETARAIFAFCKEKLAPYKRIRRLEIALLPKTISGKIRRVELRRLEAERRAKGERGELEFLVDE